MGNRPKDTQLAHDLLQNVGLGRLYDSADKAFPAKADNQSLDPNGHIVEAEHVSLWSPHRWHGKLTPQHT